MVGSVTKFSQVHLVVDRNECAWSYIIVNVLFSQIVWFVTVAVTALMGTKHGRSSLHGHFAYLNPVMLFLCIHIMYIYS